MLFDVQLDHMKRQLWNFAHTAAKRHIVKIAGYKSCLWLYDQTNPKRNSTPNCIENTHYVHYKSPYNAIAHLRLPLLGLFRITVVFCRDKKREKVEFFVIFRKNSNFNFDWFLARFGGGAVERSAASRPTPANCVPEMKVVPLNLADESDIKDPTIVVFPSCTRVKRCGGCCTNNLVSCQPMETHNIVYEVFAITFIQNIKIKPIKFQFKGLQIAIPTRRKVEIFEQRTSRSRRAFKMQMWLPEKGDRLQSIPTIW